MLQDASALMKAVGCRWGQDDWPWWVDQIMSWLKMVQSIQDGYGAAGRTYKALLKEALEFKGGYRGTDPKSGKQTFRWGPEAVYGLFQDYQLMLEAESRRT